MEGTIALLFQLIANNAFKGFINGNILLCRGMVGWNYNRSFLVKDNIIDSHFFLYDNDIVLR
jgi:hypothetical protein